MATSTTTQSSAPHSVPIVILGTDAVLAAHPATAVQLANACLRAGFSSVIPASWGDELIASATLRELKEFGPGPTIACSCPIVAHRLLTASADLRPVLLPFIPPPIAVARYVQALAHPSRARVTYVGNCPGAIDDSIDIRMTPDALIAMLAERLIVIEEQPRVFESIIPADRRRFRSQPGGLPTAEALWSEAGGRTLVEVKSDDFAAEIAQHVLAGENVLIDAAMTLGCACSGAMVQGQRHERRDTAVALEPPRASSPVIDEHVPIQLEMRVPAASRTPVDVMAVPANFSPAHPGYGVHGVRGAGLPVARPSGPHALPAVPNGPSNVPRSPANAPPATTDSEPKERKPLPRAYVIRRRPSRNTPTIPFQLFSNKSNATPLHDTQESSLTNGHSNGTASSPNGNHSSHLEDTPQPEPVQRFDQAHFEAFSVVSAVSEGESIVASQHTTVEHAASTTFTEVVDRVQMTELEGSELAMATPANGDATLLKADIEPTAVTADARQSHSEPPSRTDSFEAVAESDDFADRSAAVQPSNEPIEASADPSDAPPVLVPERQTPLPAPLVAAPIDVRDHVGTEGTGHRTTQPQQAPLLGSVPAQLKAVSQPAVKTLAFAPRQLVLLLLATAAVAIVSSMLVLSIERRFSPPATATTPNDR